MPYFVKLSVIENFYTPMCSLKKAKMMFVYIWFMPDILH